MNWDELKGESSITRSYVAWIFDSLHNTIKTIKDIELKDSLLNDLILLKNHCFEQKGTNAQDLTGILPKLSRTE